MSSISSTAPSVVSKVRVRWIRWTVAGFILVVALAGTGTILRLLNERAFERDCARVISWARTSYSAPGTYADLSLPVELRGLSDDGTVDVVVLPDGRIILLFKTSLGWHHNWSGVIYSSSPFQPSDMGQDYYGRPIIQIKGLDEHFIEKKVNDRHYKVAYDLG